MKTSFLRCCCCLVFFVLCANAPFSSSLPVVQTASSYDSPTTTPMNPRSRTESRKKWQEEATGLELLETSADSSTNAAKGDPILDVNAIISNVFGTVEPPPVTKYHGQNYDPAVCLKEVVSSCSTVRSMLPYFQYQTAEQLSREFKKQVEDNPYALFAFKRCIGPKLHTVCKACNMRCEPPEDTIEREEAKFKVFKLWWLRRLFGFLF